MNLSAKTITTCFYSKGCFRQNEFLKGLDKLLRSMDTAIMIDSLENMYKQMAVFQVYRKYASKKQTDHFDQVCRKVSENLKKLWFRFYL